MQSGILSILAPHIVPFCHLIWNRSCYRNSAESDVGYISSKSAMYSPDIIFFFVTIIIVSSIKLGEMRKGKRERIEKGSRERTEKRERDKKTKICDVAIVSSSPQV